MPIRKFARSAMAAVAVAAVCAPSAQAAPVIDATLVPNPTLANLPFAPLNIGSGGPARAVQTSGSLVVGPGVTATFIPASGVYVGDVLGTSRSPFRGAGGVAGPQHHFTALAGNGRVEFAIQGGPTNFALLWGSVDTDGAGNNRNLLQFLNGATEVFSVNGLDIANRVVGETPGVSNIAVVIRDLPAFDRVVATSVGSNAFEFALAPVPAPGALALLGAGLFGLGVAAVRRGPRRQ